MDLTRRELVGYAAASVASLVLRRIPLGASEPDGGVIVLGEHSRNPESLAGYERVLSSSLVASRPLVILPAATTIPRETVRFLHERLRNGATVIFESGAGFLSDGDEEFQRHRAQLDEAFGIRIESPIGVWPAPSVPYVEYSWPRAALIRDHSRVIPVATHRGEVIARVNGLPVAVRQRWGRGTLIVLGSPLGPALLFRDAEARLWLSMIHSLVQPRSC